ncbi:hypothetical protein CKAH01_13799 [Colletotrichum kahawae]|uniref:Uncharacterized protein n=1 Tax=Colletotrichum kahawae TaxID=34407 RepID=A0AAD9YP40_COLKA|nr:hypothetical protein CKAH01_13799 [Colletotrichum kahawae]
MSTRFSVPRQTPPTRACYISVTPSSLAGPDLNSNVDDNNDDQRPQTCSWEKHKPQSTYQLPSIRVFFALTNVT